jgi:hypothetical protein
MKRSITLVSIAIAVTLLSALAATMSAGSPKRSSDLPIITVAMDQTSIAVAGTLESGAVDIRSTTTIESEGSPALFRLDAGVSAADAFAALAAGNGDPNIVGQVGAIVFNASAPQGTSDVQTTLQPGNYIAVDTAGNDPAQWPTTTFTIAPAAEPATLPAAQATIWAMDFGFRGATTLHNGQLVRIENRGFLAYEVFGIGVKNAATAKRVTALMRAGRMAKAGALTSGFASFMNPTSHGAVQQMVVDAKPGVYVLACAMQAQDGRWYTQLGMVRTIHITK